MTNIKEKMTSLTKTVLFASLIALLVVPTAASQLVEATHSCPDAGIGGVERCYATKKYVLDDEPIAVSADVVGNDVSVSTGFLQNSLWTHFTNSRFIESGFQDTPSNNEKLVCGLDGGIDDFDDFDFDGSSDPFELYGYDLADTTWKAGIVHNSSLTLNCILTVPSGSNIIEFQIGSEASKYHNPDFDHEWDSVQLDYSDIVAADVTSLFYVEATGFDVVDCGSGNEPYQHIVTGQGTGSC